MQVLRKAHIITVKLNLTEFDAWIQGELHGYTCEAEKLPAYRHMKGELKAKNPRTGWIPAIISIQNGQTLDTIPIYESLSSLIDVGQKAKGNYFCYSYPPEVSMKICRQAGAPTYMEIALFISTHRIVEAVEQVKNKKPGIIKAALLGLKDFLLAAGADITAALIVAKMQGMF